MTTRYVRWFEELSLDDVALVGGKNASLGEMYTRLRETGVRVPNGFAVTARAYRAVLSSNAADRRLHEILDDLDPDDIDDLQQRGRLAREIVLNCVLPPDLEAEIVAAHARLQAEYGGELTLAVRSSATAEDSPTTSFAGQNESYLNIQGEQALLTAYLNCLASNFTDRSLHYKYDQGIDPFRVDLCVTVMKMVRSDLGVSGVMFTLDTESGFRDVVFINAAYGLGENVVQGTVDPDAFHVFKPTFLSGHRAVLRRRLGGKETKRVLAEDSTSREGRDTTKDVATTTEERTRFCINDDEVAELAAMAIAVEHHYGARHGRTVPLDLEWARDGLDGRLYLVQARPETVESRRPRHVIEHYHLREHPEPILDGQAIGSRIGRGRVRIITCAEGLDAFQAGEVLVADATTPDWEPVMRQAAAIVTNRGGRTCHAAIVARELGIPAIVGTQVATQVLSDGQAVTVCCAEGETGRVYPGLLEYSVDEIDLTEVPATSTGIMMNLGNPSLAFGLASLPVAGIGLARMEFIINEDIGIHPMALVHPERVDDETRRIITQRTLGFDGSRDFFIRTLAEGIATIASAVYPRPCVVRTSDFKSNEYAALVGGPFFEPDEDNPMIGFRGAIRYIHPSYRAAFELECAALKHAREFIGLDNIIVMIPFCRRVEEAARVIAELACHGLRRGEQGLEVYMMCEIPNNVVQIDAFSDHFDGFSIGSNDLTQLTLGVDRDNALVAADYDEMDPGVLEMMAMAIEGCRRNGRHCGICGQGPSDHPDLAARLVELGIDTMSLNPDSVVGTIHNVSEIESRLAADGRVSR